MYQFIFFKLSASSIILCSMRQTQKQTSSWWWFLKSHNESHYLDVRKLCEHRFSYLIIVMFHHFSVRQIMFLSHLVVLKSLRTEVISERQRRQERMESLQHSLSVTVSLHCKGSMAHFSICPPSVRAWSLAEHINPLGWALLESFIHSRGQSFEESKVSAWPFISP